MYKRIESQMVLIGMSKKDMAKKLKIGYNTLLLKLKGTSKFTFDEAVAIKEILNTEDSVEKLFDKGA